MLSFFVVVLLISSCASLTVASTITLTNNGDPSMLLCRAVCLFHLQRQRPPQPLLLNQLQPQHPKPEPTVYPTVTLNCISSAAASNLKVEITGTLTYNKQEFQARLYTSALALTAETNGKTSHWCKLMLTEALKQFGLPTLQAAICSVPAGQETIPCIG